jgi:hypothetical protein
MNLIHAVNTLDILPDDTLNLCCKSINNNPNLSRIMTITNSYKALVGISMTGVVVHVSKLWGGSASDVHITRNSGLLEQIEPGDKS